MREFLNFISLFKILMTSPTKFLIVSQILTEHYNISLPDKLQELLKYFETEQGTSNEAERNEILTLVRSSIGKYPRILQILNVLIEVNYDLLQIEK